MAELRGTGATAGAGSLTGSGQARQLSMKTKSPDLTRCNWARNPLSIRYHDEEWGVPQHDDHTLFEFLILEGAQAGLSWNTILQKRASYRLAFDRFNPERVAGYDRRKIESLLCNPGIIRNRLKIASAVQNAKALLSVQKELGSFDRYIWQFVGGKPRVNAWRSGQQVPARTPESDAMSKDLKAWGFNFVGSTICYAFMQAVGLVNDHWVECFRYRQLSRPQRQRH
jgi:DNA-3-methyladenine glycosylase I